MTDKAAVDAAVTRAHEHFGRLDVVVNNAGYGLFGTIEEVSEEQARAQIETNLFGALWVTQAALPILREQGSGHIIQVSSIGGVQRVPDASGSTTHPSGASKASARRWRRGRGLRHQGHARRADRLLDRLVAARPRSQAEHMPAYAEFREQRTEMRRAAARHAGRPAGHRPRDPESSSTPRSRRCACSSASARST